MLQADRVTQPTDRPGHKEVTIPITNIDDIIGMPSIIEMRLKSNLYTGCLLNIVFFGDVKYILDSAPISVFTLTVYFKEKKYLMNTL